MINKLVEQDNWIKPRKRRRHDCTNDLPELPQGDRGDLWRCPTCRRRWRLTLKGCNSGAHEEGVSIYGPDGSTYWRSFRARFFGGPGT